MIVVTGGGTGIGAAVARAFCANGADVVITGRRVDVLDRTAREIGARAVGCDGSRPQDLEGLRQALDGAPVDCLVNNAGGSTDIGRETGTLEQLREAWLDNFTANVLTAVLTTAALEPQLADGGSERKSTLRHSTSVDRIGVPDDVADLVQFLASDRSRHLAGQTLHLNGGAYPTR